MTLKNSPTPPTFIEHVQALNGQKEDKIVFSLILAILILAASLLYIRHPGNTHHTIVIPPEIRQSLTELSNAAEEIQMMHSLDGLSLSLAELQNLGIAPFAKSILKNKQRLVWQSHKNCYIASTETKNYQLRLLLSSTYQIDWRAVPKNENDIPPSKNDCTTLASSNHKDKNQDNTTWYRFSPLHEENKVDVHTH